MTPGIRQTVPYYLRFAWRDLRNRPLPVVGGISVTDACNLDCIHCWRKNTGKGHQEYTAILGVLNDFHARGVRFLYIQGGEPYMYRYRDKSLTDIVKAAKSCGFFHVSVCTNGTFPLQAPCDTHWVSLDGLASAHDRIRGSFSQVVENMKAASGKNQCANVTLNRLNYKDLPALAEFAASIPNLRGLMVNFHIPYPGVEQFTLSDEERAGACSVAISLKKNFPIINSVSGLRAMAENSWKKPLPYSIVSDVQSTYSCCRANGHPDICRRCGYAVWAELSRWRRFAFWEDLALLRRLHRWRA